MSARLVLLLALVGTFVGCGCLKRRAPAPSAARPLNVHRADAPLPRRVAVLPLVASTSTQDLEQGRDAFKPVIERELTRAERFETVLVTPDQLTQWTGRPQWDTQDELPENLFATLAARTGCDGVLFAKLSSVRAYPPLFTAWKFALVTTNEAIVWAADVAFDAGEPSVADAARRYQKERLHEKTVDERDLILMSPRRFAQFTVATLFDTIPPR
jgi:hypothetical protein